MNFINILRKLQTLIEREVFLFTDSLSRKMNSNRLIGSVFKYITKLQLDTWINEAENDIEELQITL